MANPTTYYFKNPAGDIIPTTDLQTAQGMAASDDYEPASAEDIQYDAQEKKYGGALNTAEAFGRGALSQATFGLSDIGTSQEGIENQEFHPTATNAGRLVGAVAPLLIPGAGEAEGLGQIADLTAPGLIAKASKSLTGALGDGLLAKGAGGALAGGLYGASNVAHEAALGDPQLTAESAATEIGLNALIGGALDIGIGATTGLVSKLVGKASGAEVADKLEEMAKSVQATAGIKVIEGNRTGVLKQLIKDEGLGSVQEASLRAQKKGWVGLTDDPTTVAEKTATGMQEEGQKIGALIQQADDAVADNKAKAPDAPALFAKIRKEILEPLQKKPLDRSAATKLAGDLDAYEKQLGLSGSGDTSIENYAKENFQNSDIGKNMSWEEAPQKLKDNFIADAKVHSPTIPTSEAVTPITWTQLHGIESDVGGKAYAHGNPLALANNPDIKAYAGALAKARSIISKTVDDGVQAAGVDGKALAEANVDFRTAATINRMATSGVPAVGNNYLGLTTRITSLGALATGHPAGLAVAAGNVVLDRFGPGLVMTGAKVFRKILQAGQASEDTQTVLGAVQDLQKTVASKISDAASSFLSKVPTAARAGALAGSAEILDNINKVNTLANNPALLMTKIQDQTGDLYGHAPNTAQALGTSEANAIRFLASQAPVTVTPGMLAEPLKPSQAALQNYHDIHQAVTDPLSVLTRGQISKAQMDAIKQTNPALYGQVMNKVMEGLLEQPKLSYAQRVRIGNVFGEDLSGTIKLLAQNQQIIRAAPKPQAGPGAPQPHRKETGSHLTIAKRSETWADRLQNGGDS